MCSYNQQAAADNLRSTHPVIEVFTVGIGSELLTYPADLENIANDPDSYYLHYMEDFLYLCNLVPTIVPKLGKILITLKPYKQVSFVTLVETNYQ